MGITEMKLRVDSENSEMFQLIAVLSNCNPQMFVLEEVAQWTEAVQATELTKRNLSLSLWTEESLSETKTLSWKPSETFSCYLATQIRLAMSSLKKSQSLRIRLSSETEAEKAKKTWMAQKMTETRLSVVLELMSTEHAAQKKGAEVAKKARF
jgi:hypothetical protein